MKRFVGRAIHDYQMIASGEKILVGVSGGVDSLTMLKLLYDLRKKAPLDFDLLPVYVDPGFKRGFAEDLKAYVGEKYGPMMVDLTDHGIVAHSLDNLENPCFVCSRLRRKRFFEIAKEQGCSKIALGHNKDDLIETLFINMFFAGKIGTMKPNQSFFNGEINIIRPLSYVEKSDILSMSRLFKFPRFTNPCPSDGSTKRDTVRQLLEDLYKDNCHIKGNIFRSMGRVKTDYLLKQTL